MLDSRYIRPPSDAATVAALNASQACGDIHPFTCPNRTERDHSWHDNGDFGVLYATPSGWCVVIVGIPKIGHGSIR